MYKTEAALSKAFNLKATKQPWLVQRIESSLTSRGIPDLYIRTKKQEYWIELKNIIQSVYQLQWIIPWRPGQQAWAARYLRIAGKPTFTVVSLNNGFLWIPMTKLFKENKVMMVECLQMTSLNDIVGVIND